MPNFLQTVVFIVSPSFGTRSYRSNVFVHKVSSNPNFKVDYSSYELNKVKHISFQGRDQHYFSRDTSSLHHQESANMGKTSLQDQCASSDSVHDESSGKHGEDVKAAFFLSNPDTSMNVSPAEMNQSMVQFPYAYTDPYFSGLFAAYGPHNMILPQVMAAASGRVPIPADLPEDGPIYVNAKQYHGILRRRQTRAKLEVQNKLVKSRKPYLHESRHQHALNRVRGTGGRFLSTKKQSQPLESLPPTSPIPDSFHFNHKMNRLVSNEQQLEADKYDMPSTTVGTRISAADAVVQQQTDSGFPSIPSHTPISMQGGGGFVYNGNRHYASIVR